MNDRSLFLSEYALRARLRAMRLRESQAEARISDAERLRDDARAERAKLEDDLREGRYVGGYADR